MTPIAVCYLGAYGDERNKCLLFDDQLVLIKDGRKHNFVIDSNVTFHLTHMKWMLPFVSGWVLICLSLLFIFRTAVNPWISLILLLLSIFAIYLGWNGSQVLVIKVGPVSSTFPLKGISTNLRHFLRFVNEYMSSKEGGSNHLHIYHIATCENWESQEEDTHYRHQSLNEEGFIHCSQKQNLIETYKEYNAQQPSLLLLTINPLKLDCELKLENAINRRGLYPHIYGPIIKEAIVAVNIFESGVDIQKLLEK